MKMNLHHIFHLATLMVISSKASPDLKLPSYVTVCYRSDLKVAECIKNNIEKLVPLFKSGSTDFDLEPLDPLDFHDLVFTYNSSIVGGALSQPKIIIEGIKNVKILNVRPSVNMPNKLWLEIDAFFPKIITYSNYSLKGNILTSQVKIDGRLDIKYEDITITYRLYGEVERKNKTDYLSLKSFTWRFFGDSIKNLTVLNDNVVFGMPVLNGILKGLLKTTWRPLMNQVLPAILARTDPALTKKFIKFFKKYPYDVLFPRTKI